MLSVGAGLTKGLTLPIVGLGAASILSFANFESAMAKIRGLVGVSDEQVKKFSNTILTEGPKWGRSPKELAEALYFITSSGIDASKAMDVLKVSARASAVGLGDTQTIANLLTSAMNAYKKSGLEAADATNILIGAVKAGKSDPAELAGAMARVLPIAAEMGISFNDVAASFAALSLTGNDAEESATQLRGIMTALLNPTAEANTELKRLGLNASDLRKELDENLLGGLEHLTSAFGGNEESAGKVFGNVRALAGIMSLLGENSETTRKIFKDLQGQEDLLGQATDANAKTTKQKFNVAMAEMKAALITFGTSIAPGVSSALETMASALRNVAHWWGKLPKGVQDSLVKMLAFGAVLGPVLIGVQKLTTAVRGLALAFAALDLAVAVIVIEIALIIALVAVLIWAFTHQTEYIRIFNGVMMWFKDQVFAIWQAIEAYISGLVARINQHFGTLFEYIQVGHNIIAAVIRGAWSIITGVIGGAVNTVMAAISRFGEIPGIVRSAFGAMLGVIVGVFQAIGGYIGSVVGWIKGVLGSLAGAAYSAGRSLGSNFGQGIRDSIGSAVSAAKDMVSKVGGLLPHSPAKWGPLSGTGSPELAGMKIATMLADGMRSGASDVLRAGVGVAQAAMVESGTTQNGSAGRGASYGTPSVNITVDSAGSRMDDLIVEVIRRAIRTNPSFRAQVGAA
jgi:TP901 family phage tail tape measure protein